MQAKVADGFALSASHVSDTSGTASSTTVMTTAAFSADARPSRSTESDASQTPAAQSMRTVSPVAEKDSLVSSMTSGSGRRVSVQA